MTVIDRAIDRVVIDSNIIFSRTLYELMGSLGSVALLYDIIWSDELLREAELSLIRRKNLEAHVARIWVDRLRQEFPWGRVDLGQTTAANPSDLTQDPDDEHVVRLALAGGADYLFSFDRGYNRDLLSQLGVSVESPDLFLVNLLAEESATVVDTVEDVARGWSGGQPVSVLLDALARAGVPKFADAVRRASAAEA